jgi:hypothetical protein
VINKGMSEDKKENQSATTKSKPDDTLGLNVSGHILIRDKETGQELVNKRNAIHYGNMAYIVAQALTQSPQDTRNAFVHYMGFGNGATSVDTAGKVVYKTPRVTESYNNDANMYNLTFWKQISSDISNTDPDNNYTQVIPGTSYTDLKMVCTMGYNEPTDAEAFDSSINNEGDYIFDELALFSYPTDTSVVESEQINTSTMLTHVVFHPVQKSKNRIIEIIYTVRIQLS